MSYGVFHSVVTRNLPSSGTPGDVWYTTDTGLIYTVVGDGSLIQLLQAVPIPVKGDPGPQGIPGPPGAVVPIVFTGTWTPLREYPVANITTPNGFLYIPLTQNINHPPPSNPICVVLS